MKKIIILVAVAFTITGTLVAQNNKANHQRVTRAQAQQNAAGRSQATVDRMTRELNLNADQQKQVYNLTLNSNKEQLRTKESIEKYNSELNKILTADQQVKMEQLKTEKSTQIDKRSIERHQDIKAAPMKGNSTEKI